MVTYSPYPVYVDGVRLDSAAWGITTKTRVWASSRNADVVLPGVDGVAASLGDTLEPATTTWEMWVLGTDANGAVPGGVTGQDQVRANLDTLAHLFSKRWALLDVQEQVASDGSLRQAFCKVNDVVAPEVAAGLIAKFTVSLEIPAGVWQDIATADWTQAAPTAGNSYEVTTLQGATAPVDDAVLLFTGPATNPQIMDTATGAYVRLNAAVAVGQVWRVNVGTWTSRYGAGLGFASLDTAGTDGQPVTVYGGGNSRFLRLVPATSSGARRVSVTVTGSGFTGATAVSVRARRKFVQ